MDTDCYGVIFGDGKFWINNDQVPSILKGDAYKEVSEANLIKQILAQLL